MSKTNRTIRSIDDPCSELALLIEAILNGSASTNSPTSADLVKARVAAASASNDVDKERYLRLAVRFADDAKPFAWRESLRSHYDLALFLYGIGEIVESKQELQEVERLIVTYFSKQCYALDELRYFIQNN